MAAGTGDRFGQQKEKREDVAPGAAQVPGKSTTQVTSGSGAQVLGE